MVKHADLFVCISDAYSRDKAVPHCHHEKWWIFTHSFCSVTGPFTPSWLIWDIPVTTETSSRASGALCDISGLQPIDKLPPLTDGEQIYTSDCLLALLCTISGLEELGFVMGEMVLSGWLIKPSILNLKTISVQYFLCLIPNVVPRLCKGQTATLKTFPFRCISIESSGCNIIPISGGVNHSVEAVFIIYFVSQQLLPLPILNLFSFFNFIITLKTY